MLSQQRMNGRTSAALLSVNDVTASPASAALQTENLFRVISLKVNVSAYLF
jgi:hypothetical protein